MRFPIAIGLLSVAVGCGVDGRGSDPDPVEPMTPLARVDLRDAMNVDDAAPVGFTINEGQRFIFDENVGLLRIDGDQTTAVVEMSSMPDPGPTAPIRPPFTDLVAYAPHVFALTALEDGYLLDTEAMTSRSTSATSPSGRTTRRGRSRSARTRSRSTRRPTRCTRSRSRAMSPVRSFARRSRGTTRARVSTRPGTSSTTMSRPRR